MGMWDGADGNALGFQVDNQSGFALFSEEATLEVDTRVPPRGDNVAIVSVQERLAGPASLGAA